ATIPHIAILKAIKRLGGELCHFSDVLHLNDCYKDSVDDVHLYLPICQHEENQEQCPVLEVKKRWCISMEVSGSTMSLDTDWDSYKNIAFRLPAEHPLLNK
ncbi:MAG TPA: hypothetical protein P5056_02670, partial [Candidatus Paceibacterota bacterium]|nr:hypothetical protein [Candidatus Paceibacterota bacterium]